MWCAETSTMNDCCFCASNTRVMYDRLNARMASRAIMRSSSVGTTSTVTFESSVEVSAHHIHLTQEHVEALFGPEHQLTKHSDLSQPGQYACKEQLAIVGPKGRIERVRVLGPTRKSVSYTHLT